MKIILDTRPSMQRSSACWMEIKENPDHIYGDYPVDYPDYLPRIYFYKEEENGDCEYLSYNTYMAKYSHIKLDVKHWDFSFF